MSIGEKTLIVLGGSGFIGRRVIQEAVKSGWRVKALARSDRSASIVCAAGASLLKGEAEHPGPWLREVAGADAIIDLIQPPRPSRLGRAQMRKISQQRQAFTRALIKELLKLSADQRPRLISVSGIDDLAPDVDGFLSSRSKLSTRESGFNTIGIPVHELIQRSGVTASFTYLASVYGPGGPFGEAIFPAVAAGKWRNFGGSADRMILIHVDDAARGLVRVASLDRVHAVAKSFVLTDNEPVTMTDFTGLAATLMGVPAPRSAPKWLATLFAGKPIVETTLHAEKTQSDLSELLDCCLIYPSYREGLPAALRALGNIR